MKIPDAWMADNWEFNVHIRQQFTTQMLTCFYGASLPNNSLAQTEALDCSHGRRGLTYHELTLSCGHLLRTLSSRHPKGPKN
jgi:hypothetical protein